jgi:hypothetical protein
MSSPDEVFVYLGRSVQIEAGILVHQPSSPDKIAALGYPLEPQIMNCMINESMIADPNHDVIVITVQPGGLSTATVTRHATSHIHMKYPVSVLDVVVPRLLQVFCDTTADVLSFVFRHDVGGFTCHEVPPVARDRADLLALAQTIKLKMGPEYECNKKFEEDVVSTKLPCGQVLTSSVPTTPP